MKLILRLFFLATFHLLTSQNASAQNENKIKKNSASLVASFDSYYTQLRVVYDRDLRTKDIGKNTDFLFSLISGLGYGSGGNDVQREKDFLTLGINSGLRFFEKHRLEGGIQYYYKREGEGYGGVGTRDEWDSRSIFRLRFGYRFEDNTLVFKAFIHPILIEQENYNYETSTFSTHNKLFLEPGFGFGIRF